MKCVLIPALLGCSLLTHAQRQPSVVKHHKKHKVIKKKPVKQTPEKRQELLKRTLKEKNFHIPDTSKH